MFSSAVGQAPRRGAGHWVLLSAGFAMVLFFVAVRLFTTPDPSGHSTHEQLGLPACTLMVVTGFPCPGCGVTTAMSHLVHGQLRMALVAQPFGVLLAFIAALVAAFSLWDSARGHDAWSGFRRRWRPWMSWGLGGAMLAGWIYKIVVLFA